MKKVSRNLERMENLEKQVEKLSFDAARRDDLAKLKEQVFKAIVSLSQKL